MGWGGRGAGRHTPKRWLHDVHVLISTHQRRAARAGSKSEGGRTAVLVPKWRSPQGSSPPTPTCTRTERRGPGAPRRPPCPRAPLLLPTPPLGASPTPPLGASAGACGRARCGGCTQLISCIKGLGHALRVDVVDLMHACEQRRRAESGEPLKGLSKSRGGGRGQRGWRGAVLGGTLPHSNGRRCAGVLFARISALPLVKISALLSLPMRLSIE